MTESADEKSPPAPTTPELVEQAQALETEHNAPTEARQIQSFAKFFKNYMSVSSVVVAALPIPVTAFGAIPTFRAQTRLLATYTPMLCFLLLAFAFFCRHHIAAILFSRRPSREVNN